ncbi:HNH endonuclease family protein [Microbacterium sp.]|uniref:HNH endonuclease family protein n=1 Tax=Microbacterium sp. TaxID=51671 RepID=UPI003A90DB68
MKKRFWRRPVVWVGIGVFVTALAIAASEAGSGVTAPDPAALSAPTPTLTAVESPSPPTPTPTATPTPTSTPSPTPSAAKGTALALLQTLPVKGRAPKTGYDRPVVFGQAWKDVDRNGCDTRNDILRRDLKNLTIKAGTHGCVVLTGILHDPYTGTTVDFTRGVGTSNTVQIDHVVALLDAWQKGAQQLSQAEREALANDPLNLLAVSGRVNEQKSAGDAATWLPPAKGYRCAYVARQITVKAKYRLWVTAAERDAMTRILQACPGQKVATAGVIRLLPDAPSSTAPRGTAPAPAPSKPAPAKPAIVHPGSFCAPVGATGVTVKGTPMTCTLKSGETRARWRSS